MLTRRLARPSATLFAGLLAAGCPGPEPEEPGDLEPGPCDEAWGTVPEGGRIHVDASAEDGGDGSAGAPFADLFADGGPIDSGIEAARESGIRQVVLGPGEYPGAYVLSGDDPEWLDSGMEIAGCGVESSFLVAVRTPDPVGQGDFLRSNVEIWGSATAGIVLRDVALVGGRRGLVVRAGAGSAGPVVASRVRIEDAVRLAVLVDGVQTRVLLEDVDVDGVVPDDGVGWGIAIQTRAGPIDSPQEPTVLLGVTVQGASGVGILAHAAWVDMTDVAVSGTSPDPDTGRWGRGIQLQERTYGTLEGLLLEGNSDAALFLHAPGRDGEALHVRDGVVRSTLPGSADGDETGDGMVVTQADAQQPPDSYLATVEGIEFAANPRSHLLAEGVTLQVGTDNIFGKGTDFPFASQGGALVQGVGGGEPGAPPEELAGDAALSISGEPLALDDLVE